MYHLKDWYVGTNEWINMGVISDGTYYDIPEGICISMPVKCANFQYQVITDLELSQHQMHHIQLIVNELITERNSIHETIYHQ
jgi:malate/lactate dehydrogenase